MLQKSLDGSHKTALQIPSNVNDYKFSTVVAFDDDTDDVDDDHDDTFDVYNDFDDNDYVNDYNDAGEQTTHELLLNNLFNC